MCRAVSCSKCGKTTWAGCGAHIEQVMAGVAQKDRCTCEREAPQSLWSSIKQVFEGKPK
jgi:hypothetical protein